jgi:hypothetical protein
LTVAAPTPRPASSAVIWRLASCHSRPVYGPERTIRPPPVYGKAGVEPSAGSITIGVGSW